MKSYFFACVVRRINGIINIKVKKNGRTFSFWTTADRYETDLHTLMASFVKSNRAGVKAEETVAEVPS